MNVKLSITHDTRKVSVIGVGFVGASITYALMLKELAREIVLIDIDKNTVDAEALDIRHGIPYIGTANIRAGDYSDIKDSDLIIVTAGRNRRPGENRLDLAADNIKIAKNAAKQIEKYYTRGVILVVSNPNDIITYKLNEWLKLPDGMIFGTGCILDSSRLVNVIADYVGLNPGVISAQVIGEHGESQIALWNKVTIVGIAMQEYCNTLKFDFDEDCRNIMERQVLDMGARIISGKGKTHYGIATCVCYIADAILNRRATIACVSSVLNGEHGISDVSLSLPCIINYNGVSKRLEERLSDNETKRLHDSADTLKVLLKMDNT